MKKLIALLLALTMLCAATALADAVNTTDMLGREIVLEAPAQRLIVITAADVEIVYALGAGESVIAVGAWCDYPADVNALPKVQSGADTDVEEILALNPDVVIMDTMAQTAEQVEALENAGVKVVMTDADSIADTLEAIALIGAVTGKDAEAAAMVEDMLVTFAAVAAMAPETDLTVYFEISPLEWGLWAAGNGSFMQELAELCGLTNIFAELPAWAAISAEDVLAVDPDIIITTTGYYGYGPLPEEEIAGREGWDSITAVANGNVYAVDNNVFTRPGPRLTEAATTLLQIVLNMVEEAVPAA